jgi:hypothetical protein
MLGEDPGSTKMRSNMFRLAPVEVEWSMVTASGEPPLFALLPSAFSLWAIVKLLINMPHFP